jgi:hypothetical protein
MKKSTKWLIAISYAVILGCIGIWLINMKEGAWNDIGYIILCFIFITEYFLTKKLGLQEKRKSK